MDCRQLLAAGLGALTLAVSPLLAQGPFYRERWADLHLELLRERVVRECAGRDDGTVANVARMLVNVDDSIPFRPAAHALAPRGAHLPGTGHADAAGGILVRDPRARGHAA